MIKTRYLLLILLIITPIFALAEENRAYDAQAFNPAQEQIGIYWKDETGKRFGTIRKLKDWLLAKGLDMDFATNGGIYAVDYSPLGLHIENGKILKPLNLNNGSGNFFMKPNAVFYVDNSKAHVVDAAEFKYNKHITAATQSGPMLVKNGVINKKFIPNSENRLIRSGVGLDEDGNAVFVISKEPINFYDFSKIFLRLTCTNAMFLDGTISRMYVADKRNDQNGDFTSIIAVTHPHEK